MKEFILLPKHMYDMYSKNSEISPHPTTVKKDENQQVTPISDTAHPVIPLRQMYTVENSNNDTEFTDTNVYNHLPLYFKTDKRLHNARLLFHYFRNHIDNHGNINSPPGTHTNVIDVIKDFLSVRKQIANDELLNFYKYMLNKLNIPPHLIQNTQLKKIHTVGAIKHPVGGYINKIYKVKQKKRNILHSWRSF